MKKHKYTHEFVETYGESIMFGWDRKTDEAAVTCYLQMFSDDKLLATLLPRLSNEELTEIYDLINRIIKAHLEEPEYHALFLKEDH